MMASPGKEGRGYEGINIILLHLLRIAALAARPSQPPPPLHDPLFLAPSTTTAVLSSPPCPYTHTEGPRAPQLLSSLLSSVPLSLSLSLSLQPSLFLLLPSICFALFICFLFFVCADITFYFLYHANPLCFPFSTLRILHSRTCDMAIELSRPTTFLWVEIFCSLFLAFLESTLKHWNFRTNLFCLKICFFIKTTLTF